MKTFIVSCVLVGMPLLAVAGDDAKKAPAGAGSAAAGAPAPPADKAPAPMAKPTPAKEVDALKPWLKTFACTGTGGDGQKGTAKMTFKKELDGFWTSVRFEAKGGKGPMFVGQAMLGIDPVSKSWQMEGWDNFGGTLHLKAPMTAVTADAQEWDGKSVDNGKETTAKFHMATDAKTKHVHFWAEFGGQKGFDYDCK